jgi:2,4-dienoyl-CoA reductase-like NADH-dependent reductase (Old Yellow Enzyme family)
MTHSQTTHSESTTLSRPLALPGGAVLRNRFVKAAMSELLADRRTGAPTESLIALYERWGRSGAGLLLTGNVIVDRDGREAPGNVVLDGVDDDRHLPLLRRWAEAAQREGASLWMQINHGGRQTPRRIARRPLAPSAVALRRGGMFGRPFELTEPEIYALIARFAGAARTAQRAGFGGVQIHAAHGYLISQFLSPLTNRRDDAWGGDEARRRRFLIEIVRAMRAAVGPAFPIGVKLNSADFQRGGFTEAESMNVVRALEAEGIDLLEISGGNYERPAMMVGGDDGNGNDGDDSGKPERASTRAREAYFLDYARAVRAITSTPLLLTGGMRTAAVMNDVVASGAVDLVGLGRPMAVEPELPARILSGDTDAYRGDTPRVGVRLLDDMLQGAWYHAQFRRIARGLDPDPALGAWGAIGWALARVYAHSPIGAPWRRPRRPRLELLVSDSRTPPALGPAPHQAPTAATAIAEPIVGAAR